MDSLVLKGLTEVEGMRFHDIEGGFGEGKKSMLVKDIALIHDRDLKDINRLINNNIKRFKNNVDIIDLKVGDFKSLTLEMGYTNQSYANANNIYILSERGYAKLLKILEDDKAWEQYDKLVDGYFEMPKTIKELAQEMTKEEFLKHADDEGECPHKYGLDGSIDKKDCNGGFDIEECHNCWNKATKDINFRQQRDFKNGRNRTFKINKKVRR